jgi:putative acetyltransferase
MASRKKRKVRIKVRGYESDDASSVARLLGGKNVVASTLQLPHRSIDEVTRLFDEPDPAARILVAQMDGDAVAVGGLRLHESPRARHVAYLWLVVADDVQGRGIGAVLLDELLALGERWMGILRFQLEVNVDDEAAITLYRSRDFEIEGVIRGRALRDGELVDGFSMGRIAEELPWPRVTARDVAQRMPALLPSGPDRSKN